MSTFLDGQIYEKNYLSIVRLGDGMALLYFEALTIPVDF
jgi:hypothetical protein